jgi:transposase InsO family protein
MGPDRPLRQIAQQVLRGRVEVLGVAIARVAVQTPFQRQFQAAKQVDLPLFIDFVEMGIWTRTHAGQAVDGLIHHSDRGGQYLAIRYTQLAETGAVASVGSRGDSYDGPARGLQLVVQGRAGPHGRAPAWRSSLREPTAGLLRSPAK